MSQEVNGWSFPDDVDVPGSSWYRMQFGGREVWDMDKWGHLHVLHQLDVVTVDQSLVDSGVDDQGIRYAAVQTHLAFEDGRRFSAIAGADETSDQVRDPEHTHSVAATRSLKNAIKYALNIRPVGETTVKVESGREEPLSPHDEPEPATTVESSGDLEW